MNNKMYKMSRKDKMHMSKGMKSYESMKDMKGMSDMKGMGSSSKKCTGEQAHAKIRDMIKSV